jgi:hypothetical protein
MVPYLWRFEKGMKFGPEILIRLLPAPQRLPRHPTGARWRERAGPRPRRGDLAVAAASTFCHVSIAYIVNHEPSSRPR